eukprot:CAMPEP_0183290862 /NCGR_PEP_ID=MMETSP0160_2-20130417/449_1 /TAXON_ID=2839 ORGANISM="Odontella Sinensis, Strain Grunow 1884" /NCGR_SAMPLE_ID=MMETSP0160_2 /ASSEMBLY_ACC=CAM_ASM_000250 /LENGTH=391 /DNA_ID=CAMNT_0025451549 /DNA_START=58 /DNA_END=1233 /DNA_ORIENTATION=+
MPELPEVEHYRRLLLPLVAAPSKSTSGLEIELTVPVPPKSFPAESELKSLGDYRVSDVTRKGKLVRLELDRIGGGRARGKAGGGKPQSTFLYLHFGMTGRISTPQFVPSLESLGSDDYPPPHTQLILRSNGHEASFSDPRRFGSVAISTDDQFEELAPDALTDEWDATSLSGRRKGIKGVLLDQRAVVSGVGNWVADEVFYQCGMHPDQTWLTNDEADSVKSTLIDVLKIAVTCLDCGEEFPEDWIFNHRWNKAASSRGHAVKDFKGRNITFLTSGGRTSAVVPSIQKLKSRKTATVGKSPKQESGLEPGSVGSKGKARKSSVKRQAQRNTSKEDKDDVVTTKQDSTPTGSKHKGEKLTPKKRTMQQDTATEEKKEIVKRLRRSPRLQKGK